MDFKKSFLEYCLYKYDQLDKDIVWLLNFIKSDSKLLKNISFIDSESSIQLFINENTPHVMLKVEDHVYLNIEDILYVLNKYKENNIYVHLTFKSYDKKYHEFKLEQIKQYYPTVSLEMDALEDHIDVALMTNNKKKFYILSKLMKIIK